MTRSKMRKRRKKRKRQPMRKRNPRREDPKMMRKVQGVAAMRRRMMTAVQQLPKQQGGLAMRRMSNLILIKLRWTFKPSLLWPKRD